MKRCGHCGKILPESEFYRDKTRRTVLTVTASTAARRTI